jgi:hypothetical protein
MNSTPYMRLAGAIGFAPANAPLPVVGAAKAPRSGMRRRAAVFLQCARRTRAQNVAGCGSTPPLGGANWPGKYAGRYSDADAGNRDSPDAAGSDMERVIGAPPASVGYRLCSIDVLGLLGEAVSRGCSSITVTNPSAAIKAATFTDALKRLLLEYDCFGLDIANSSCCVGFAADRIQRGPPVDRRR